MTTKPKGKSRPHPTVLRDKEETYTRAKRIPVALAPAVHERVKAIADFNHRNIVDQIAYWADHDNSVTP